MDEEMKHSIETLKKLSLPLATVYFKVPDENLLRERLGNDVKTAVAHKIVSEIRARKTAYDQTDPTKRPPSTTSVPFFDVDYRTVLKIILKNFDKDLAEVPPNKEFFILNKHIYILERLFGFKFSENKTLSAINNQSFVGMDMIYPSVRGADLDHGDHSGPLKEGSSKYLEQLERKKSFHVFNEPSTIITDEESFSVNSSA